MEYPGIILGGIILAIGIVEKVAGVVLVPRLLAGLSSGILKKEENKELFNAVVAVKCLIGGALVFFSIVR